MKMTICLVLTAMLSACIPIGIRGTSIVDAGAQHSAASSPAGDTAAIVPASQARRPQRA